jgi:hypothetical protein
MQKKNEGVKRITSREIPVYNPFRQQVFIFVSPGCYIKQERAAPTD